MTLPLQLRVYVQLENTQLTQVAVATGDTLEELAMWTREALVQVGEDIADMLQDAAIGLRDPE